MRLRRLRLEHWRGVEAREIEFGDGVTIVEGPNEAGKTSLIEALHTLIRELDSSGKQAIKAVKPVDRDVGSTVEADIETGDYCFTYSKTYNRDRKTSLSITAPTKEQVTGREAHERAQQILDETVDLGLWEALLVDQGEKIAPANIKDSAGLSHALDEAAGTGTVGEDDTDLYEAVQAEYEKYFTLRTGKSRFEKQAQACERAKSNVAAAAEALRSVEADAERYERLSADVLGRERTLPQLERSAGDYEKQWREIDRIKGALTVKQKNHEAAAGAVGAAIKALEERTGLISAADQSKQAITGAEKSIEPRREAVEASRRQADSARRAVTDLRQRRTEARDRLNTARADARHLRQLGELDEIEKRLAEVVSVTKKIKECAATVAEIAIDGPGLEKLQAAENQLIVLEGQRDVAATSITVTAESEQELLIGGKPLSLKSGEGVERQLAARTSISLPGIATIDIEPPQTAADLELEVSEARAACKLLQREYDVANSTEGASQLVRRQSAEAELEQAKRREQVLLDGKSRAEIEQLARKLDQDLRKYADARGKEPTLPVSVDAAEGAADALQLELDGIDQEIHDAEARAESLQQALQAAEAGIREAELDLSGLRATLEDRTSRLARQREDMDDERLREVLQAARSKADACREALADARRQLDELEPERIEMLYENAKAAHDRAREELARLRTELAILEDRLEQSQASGRFEALEQAQREFDEAENRYASTRRRADAAQRLWRSLNEHRDAARQAYVRPLKDAIERLGRLVFGDDFEVQLGDDWAIESRTLDGKTLPYDALSIGAKEQLGILTRLAAARIVSRQGGVPLIIDDALGFSDPGRLETMGAAISAAGKKCQVIILTCTPGRFTHVGNAKVVGL